MRSDPDRPLLRLLNRAHGKPVLVMCGLPGNHDAAHAAAGRLPVRFHKYSDVRLYWREFSGSSATRIDPRSCWLPDRQQPFVALIVLTNFGKAIVDVRSTEAILDFRRHGKPVLWGEACPKGAIAWRPEFHVENIEHGPEFYMGEIGNKAGSVFESGLYQWVSISHYRLVAEPA